MVKSKETEVLPEPVPLEESPCGSCGGDGLILVGWDEEGEDVFGPCVTCGGDGIK